MTETPSVPGTAITIRPFEPADQDAMRRLVLAGLVEHWGFLDETKNPDLVDIQRSYVAERHAVLVALVSGQIVGSGVLLAETDQTGRIVRMSVDLARRRSGIGRMMLARLLEIACDRGYREVLVETNNDWYPAIALYKSGGFVEYDRDEESVYLRLTLEGRR